MTLRLVETAEDIRAFEAAFDVYLTNDIIPNGDLGEPMTKEDLAYFRSEKYRGTIAALCARETDPVHRYFVMRDGLEIGFVMCCTYHSEDGKCFIMEQCIYAPYRGKGSGREAFALLRTLESAAYYELSTHSVRAKRFWESLGFQPVGLNENGGHIMRFRPIS